MPALRHQLQGQRLACGHMLANGVRTRQAQPPLLPLVRDPNVVRARVAACRSVAAAGGEPSAFERNNVYLDKIIYIQTALCERLPYRYQFSADSERGNGRANRDGAQDRGQQATHERDGGL